MKLDENTLIKLPDYEHEFITFEGKSYFCKRAIDEGLELVGNRLANKMGILSSKDYLVKTPDGLFYLSYNFNNDAKFISAAKLGIKLSNLYSAWDRLENLYPTEVEKLMQQLVKVFLFDIFLMYGDRHLGNYGILENVNQRDIAILDNDLIFSDTEYVRLKPKYNAEDKLRTYSNTGVSHKKSSFSILHNMENLEYFIATTSKEFYPIIKEFYNVLTPDLIYEVIKQIEHEENIKFYELEYMMMLYNENYKGITNLLKMRGIINGERIFKDKWFK